MVKRFSRFLTLTLLGFIGLALTLVVGSLYSILSATMIREYASSIRVQQSETGMELNQRFTLIESRIREASLNNALRVNLMLGVKSQLFEIMRRHRLFVDGASFFIQESEGRHFIPKLPEKYEALRPHLLALRRTDQFRSIKFQPGRQGACITLLACPIERKKQRLGTIYAIYDLSQDTGFWARFQKTPSERLLLLNREGLIDLRTARVTPLPPEMRTLLIENIESPKVNFFKNESIVGLKDFPGIFYAVSSGALRKDKHALFIQLSALCSLIFCLTLLLSSQLIRKITDPLESMAEQALAIAENPSGRYLDEESIKYSEFRMLARGFNQVLKGLVQAQEKLKKWAIHEIGASEERHRRTLEAAPDAITMSRLNDGRYLQVNDVFCKMTGYSREAVLGKTPFDLNLYVNAADRQQLIRLLQASGEANGLEVKFRRKDGSIVTVMLSARSVNFDRVECLIVVASDITQQKQTEAEKRLLEKKLQRAQNMEAIGTLAGGVAHDLNNILSGLVSYPELLLMDLPSGSPLRGPLQVIKKSGEKAAVIVQDLLTLARRAVAVREVVSLNHIISEYFQSPEYKKLKRYHPTVRFACELKAGRFNIMGSPVHLSKMIMNLVSNAAESMPDGGVVTIKTEDRCIDCSSGKADDMAPGRYILLTVTDTGSGISPEDMERIFEPFYTKKIMGRSGTGLGMSVVWGTVEDHRGHITVQSEEGSGSTFSVHLPATEETIPAEKSDVSVDEYRGNGESVLIVDDMAEQRTIASDMMQKLNYTVSTAASGIEALAYLAHHPVDLVVLDMIMDPGIDGLETYKRILERHPAQKAIIASGFSETDRVKMARHLGADVYIKKPYSLEKMGVAVKKALAC